MKNNSRIGIYFPGWTRKSVTFTIDDGNIIFDTKFIEIIKPYGILGTFNLCEPTKATPDEYRSLYREYEIANHCKNHPLVFDEEQPYTVSEDDFDRLTSREYTEEDPVVYKTNVPGLYRIHSNPSRIKPDGWFSITDRENYFRFACECREELEAIFGKGSVKSFVWPYKEQSNGMLFESLKNEGYNSIRKTGAVGSSTAFELPSDRMRWSYNAGSKTLLSLMDEYEKIADDGNLKFFCFGLHSYDYEKDGRWGELAEFAEKYGNRPEDYYYATVSDIFEYEDAVKGLEITDSEILNNSEISVYVTVDGVRKIIAPKSKITI